MTSTGIRLHAPAPGWAISADVVVVGSGVAGLTTALRCEAAGLTTVVVTKARLDDGSTRWAQGGMNYWAVSDLNAEELWQFAQAVRAAVGH